MLGHLHACDDKDKFPRFLPPGTKVAFKTGSVDASRTAAGIIYTTAGPVALCVLTHRTKTSAAIPTTPATCSAPTSPARSSTTSSP